MGRLCGEIAFYRDPAGGWAYVDQSRALARSLPERFIDVTLAVWVPLAGRTEDSQAEWIGSCPPAGSRLRQLDWATMLAFMIAQASDRSAAIRLREVTGLIPHVDFTGSSPAGSPGYRPQDKYFVISWAQRGLLADHSPE